MAALSLASATVVPPLGAALLNVTVPVLECVPSTDTGLSVTLTSVAGVIVSAADLVVPFSVPLIFAVVEDATAEVVTVNVPVVLPATTVTAGLLGTCAAALSFASVTVMPPLGAALLNVTVPVVECVPSTDTGLNVMLTNVAGVIVRTAVWDAPL